MMKLIETDTKGGRGADGLTLTERIQQIINRPVGTIQERDKEFLFQYAKTSPDQIHSSAETLDRFAKNLIVIINSFFEYGFVPRGPDSNYTVSHYWELLTEYFGSYSSVQYINDQFGQTQRQQERALSWLILVLNEENVLFYCFHEIFNNREFLSHYDKTSSYLITNRT